jgi:hypothetical protein
MRRAWVAIMAAFALTQVVLLAADFWEKKKFPGWSEKEIGKMLTDSPWARPVLISLGTFGIPAGGVQTSESGRSGTPCASCEDRPSPVIGTTQLPGMAPPVSVLVRWHTALPVKQAMAKLRFGDEVASSPVAAELLSRQETNYVVSLSGLPPATVPEDMEQVKASASLNVKGRPPIQAEQVQGSGGRETVNLAIVFPRGQNGNHLITLEDREVELKLKLGAIQISRKFKLKDMVYEGKLEL